MAVKPKPPLDLTLPADDVDYFFLVHGAVYSSETAKPIPHLVNMALDAFRMAATNLPIKKERLANARQDLDDVVADWSPEVAKVIAVEAAQRHEAAQEKAKSKINIPSYLKKSCYVGRELHEVTRGLFCGSYHPANDLALLQQNSITHVLCCINVQGRFPNDLKYMVLPADDSPGYNIRQHFDDTFQFIEDALEGGGRVLVHCGAGISRAPTVLSAYLMRKLRVSHYVAVKMVKNARSCANPNSGFMNQLAQFHKDLKERWTLIDGSSAESSMCSSLASMTVSVSPQSVKAPTVFGQLPNEPKLLDDPLL